jgi:Uma2 family endonuclease
MSLQIEKHYFTVADYNRMGEAGILSPDARFELIEGEIIEMPPIGSPHAAGVDVLARLLRKQVEDFAIIRVQSPIQLDDYSEPEPDLALLRLRDDFYRRAHPMPDDVLLVIEVSDTTLRFDREIKLPLYAKAGIAEVWIVNLPEEQIEIYAQPVVSVYQRNSVFKRGTQAQSQNCPDIRIDVDTLFG